MEVSSKNLWCQKRLWVQERRIFRACHIMSLTLKKKLIMIKTIVQEDNQMNKTINNWSKREMKQNNHGTCQMLKKKSCKDTKCCDVLLQMLLEDNWLTQKNSLVWIYHTFQYVKWLSNMMFFTRHSETVLVVFRKGRKLEQNLKGWLPSKRKWLHLLFYFDQT